MTSVRAKKSPFMEAVCLASHRLACLPPPQSGLREYVFRPPNVAPVVQCRQKRFAQKVKVTFPDFTQLNSSTRGQVTVRIK